MPPRKKIEDDIPDYNFCFSCGKPWPGAGVCDTCFKVMPLHHAGIKVVEPPKPAPKKVEPKKQKEPAWTKKKTTKKKVTKK